MTNADQNSQEPVFWLQSVACSMSDRDKKNYDSNYFWSIIVDSIDVFDSAYKVWFCCMLHDVTVDISWARHIYPSLVLVQPRKIVPHDWKIVEWT